MNTCSITLEYAYIILFIIVEIIFLLNKTYDSRPRLFFIVGMLFLIAAMMYSLVNSILEHLQKGI